MKLKPASKSLAAILATAAPILLLTGGEPLATEAAIDADCVVGTAGFPTIQSAVNNASCHTIMVPGGTFRENVTINPAPNIIHTNITIRGAGPDSTIVNGSNAAAPVFSIGGQRAGACGEPVVSVTLEGMTITGGTGPSCPPETPQCQRNGGGVAASPGTKLVVKNCAVTGNSAYMNGGGISVPNGRLTVMDSVISGNTAWGNPQPGQTDPNFTGGGGGVRTAGCPNVLIVSNTVIQQNVSYRHGGGILSHTALTPAPVQPAGTLVVDRSEINNNTAAAANGGGGIYYTDVDLTDLKAKVKNNYPDNIKPSPSF